IDRRGGRRTVVRTSLGDVECDSVVIATLAPIFDPTLVFARVTPTMSHALAAQLDGPAPQDSYLSVDEPTRSIRPVAGALDRVVLGGAGHRGAEADQAARSEEVRGWSIDTVAVADVTDEWSAHDLTPSDSVPFVGRVAGDDVRSVFVASGFQKWGFTN